ncbi:MAG: hypothetical protein AAF604_13710 [Acidobacteriota bacterium]
MKKLLFLALVLLVLAPFAIARDSVVTVEGDCTTVTYYDIDGSYDGCDAWDGDNYHDGELSERECLNYCYPAMVVPVEPLSPQVPDTRTASN